MVILTRARDSGFNSTAKRFEDINNASLLTRGAYYARGRVVIFYSSRIFSPYRHASTIGDINADKVHV